VKTVADGDRLAAQRNKPSTANELSAGTNIDDLGRP